MTCIFGLSQELFGKRFTKKTQTSKSSDKSKKHYNYTTDEGVLKVCIELAEWSRRTLADIKPEIVQRYKLERRKENDTTACNQSLQLKMKKEKRKQRKLLHSMMQQRQKAQELRLTSLQEFQEQERQQQSERETALLKQREQGQQSKRHREKETMGMHDVLLEPYAISPRAEHARQCKQVRYMDFCEGRRKSCIVVVSMTKRVLARQLYTRMFST